MIKKLAELTPEMEAQQLYDDAQALRRAGKLEAAMSKYRLALERQPGMRECPDPTGQAYAGQRAA